MLSNGRKTNSVELQVYGRKVSLISLSFASGISESGKFQFTAFLNFKVFIIPLARDSSSKPISARYASEIGVSLNTLFTMSI